MPIKKLEEWNSGILESCGEDNSNTPLLQHSNIFTPRCFYGGFTHNMHIQIKYLVTLRERTGKRQEHVSFSQGSTLHDVAAWLNDQYIFALPDPRIITMLNGKEWNLYPQKWSTEVQDGDVITLFPPISGG